MVTDWALSQQTQLNAFFGVRIDGWRGIEMAFESDEANPVWRHPSIDAIQCTVVDVFVDERWRRFDTSTGDDPVTDWGLIVEDAPSDIEPIESDTTIFRIADLSTLPYGIISSVTIETDAYGMVGCMHIQIGDTSVSLSAGEAYDNGAGGFRIADYDESLLIRLNNRHPEGGEIG